MARENRRNGGATDSTDDIRDAAIGVMGQAQERVRAGAEKAAEVLPDAVAGAQVAARDTQRALTAMSDQGLIVGASFSLGLAVGLFLSGANRLLIALALAPAAAMVATLFGRDEEAAGTATARSGAAASTRSSGAAKSRPSEAAGL